MAGRHAPSGARLVGPESPAIPLFCARLRRTLIPIEKPVVASGVTVQSSVLKSVLVIALVLSACRDRNFPTNPVDVSRAREQLIACQAAVAARTITCDEPTTTPAPGMALSVTVGGPYAQLVSSGTAYNGTVFSSNVTIQNKTVQPMGTGDGTTGDGAGIRVFFQDGPTATGGAGSVSVMNADGQGNFTGTNQPYFQYAGPLTPNATSPAKVWQWNVPNTVTVFTFTVLISTKLPDDGGVLRWINETGTASADLGEASEANNEIWAVGSNATILHYNGTSWSTQASPLPGVTLRGVEMYSGTPVTGFAVGDNSTILRYDGSNWNVVTNPASGGSTYITLCRIDATTIYVVGFGGDIVHSTDNGAQFTQETPPAGGSADYFTCWGANAGDVYISGLQGVILHSSGNGTWAQQNSNTTNALRAVTWIGNGGGGVSEIWLTGGTPGGAGVMLHSTGNGTWTPVPFPGQPIIRGLRENDVNSASDIYGVGTGGVIIHYNGSQWSTQYSGTSTQLNHVAFRRRSGGAREWWVVGNAGIVLLGTR